MLTVRYQRPEPDWTDISVSTILADHIPALTDRHPIRFTLTHCHYPWQLNHHGVLSTYRSGLSVQIDGASSNCPNDANPLQDNNDGDDEGDVCDLDDDNDGLSDIDEADLGSDPFEPDTESDGVVDGSDNCLLSINADQTDTDNDGYGNQCDPDFDNNLIVNASDLAFLKTKFFLPDADADLNGDSVVNAGDLAIMKSFFFKPPGPSGIVH